MASSPEPVDQLRDHLASLHRELGRGPDLDQETRGLLEALQGDIERLLAQDVETGPAEHASVLERLQEAAVDAQRTNPTLADAINRVAQILSNMGI